MGEDQTKFVDDEVEQLPKFSDEEKTLPITPKDAAEYIDGKKVALAQVQMEKRLALIKAWEDNEKTKADNKAYKKLSGIDSWENSKKASVEAQMRLIEEEIERKKAECGEKMKNKMAILHREAEEKRVSVETDRETEFLVVEEAAAKFRSTGRVPKKVFACFTL